MRFVKRFFLLSLGLFMIVTAVTAIAATNTVPPTKADDKTILFQIGHLRPSACAGLSLSNLVTGSGTLTGTEGNDLILASSTADTINGMGGSDCIVGGGGDDLIDGGADADLCLGGAGNDTFSNCEGENQ
jgi:Ca2+-binding RTX toxin-like protein